MPLRLSVQQVNDALSHWPLRTKKWPIPGYRGYWLRARPIGNGAPQPFLKNPGAEANSTEPDGLYLFLHEGQFVDLIAIEVCGTMQNFHDKRARYQAEANNSICVLPDAWLHSDIQLQHGGQRKLWEASNWFSSAPDGNLEMNIRHKRVLFALTEGSYHTWGANNVVAGHEYFCMHEHLLLIQNRNVQNFIKGIAPIRHYLRRPQRGH